MNLLKNLISKLLAINVTLKGEMNRSFLDIKEGCVCPSHTLTLECTIVAPQGGSIVWRGTNFDCPNSDNEIILLYTRFNESSGASGSCNNGSIVAQILRVNAADTYISQLNVAITKSNILGNTITCQDGEQSIQNIKLTKKGMLELAIINTKVILLLLLYIL